MPGYSSGARAADAEHVAGAAQALAAGGLVVYPTETVYGLGADATNPQALERLVAVKGREPGKPIAVLVSDMEMLDQVATRVSAAAGALMRRFWPGPLTIVVPARPDVSPILCGASDGIGVRLSSHPLATALVRALGRPVTTPSANPAGQPPAVTAAAARAYFGDRVDVYLDGGHAAGEPASTVIDVRGAWRIIREGAVSAVAVREAIGPSPGE